MEAHLEVGKMNTITEESKIIISHLISQIESHTSGEVRVCISKESCAKEGESVEQSVREKAKEMFASLGIGETRHSTGVLVFISPADRHAVVCGDKSIDARIDGQKWLALLKPIQKYAKKGKLVIGIIKSLKKIGRLLEKEFPIRENDTDELDNTVVIC